MIINHIFSIFVPSMYMTHSSPYSFFFFFFHFFCLSKCYRERSGNLGNKLHFKVLYERTEQLGSEWATPLEMGMPYYKELQNPSTCPRTHTHNTHTPLIQKHLCCSISLKLYMLKTCFSLIAFFLPQMSQRYGDIVRNKGRI